MKATTSVLSFMLLSFFLPICSSAQCWNTVLVSTQCDNCAESYPSHTKLICQPGEGQGSSCSPAATSYPCKDPEIGGYCYGIIYSARTYGTCRASSAPTEKHQMARQRLAIFIPNADGGYQEAGLTAPHGPSQKVNVASGPLVIFVPNSGGGYQDASFAATSCSSAGGPQR